MSARRTAPARARSRARPGALAGARTRARLDSQADARVGQQRRLRRSIALLAGCALAVAVLGSAASAFSQAGRPSVLAEAASLALSGAVDGADEDAGDEVPDGFQAEVMDLSSCEQLRCDRESGVVGFVGQGEAQEVFDELAAVLCGGGWTAVESGLDSCGTFVKATGVYRWIFVSCTQVGDQTSVVMQVEGFEEGE